MSEIDKSNTALIAKLDSEAPFRFKSHIEALDQLLDKIPTAIYDCGTSLAALSTSDDKNETDCLKEACAAFDNLERCIDAAVAAKEAFDRRNSAAIMAIDLQYLAMTLKLEMAETVLLDKLRNFEEAGGITSEEIRRFIQDTDHPSIGTESNVADRDTDVSGADCPFETTPEPRGHKNNGGRRPVWDWESAIGAACLAIYGGDLKEDDRPSWVKYMAYWLSQRHPQGESPNDREIRRRAEKIEKLIKSRTE